MALNIRNPEAERLAEALAKLAGETKTQAVTRALRDRPLDYAGRRLGGAWPTSSTRSQSIALGCRFGTPGLPTRSWDTTNTAFPADGRRHLGSAGDPSGRARAAPLQRSSRVGRLAPDVGGDVRRDLDHHRVAIRGGGSPRPRPPARARGPRARRGGRRTGARRARGVQPLRQGPPPGGPQLRRLLSYALARVLAEPLLFKGGDFSQTDLQPFRPAQ